jgi:hypothetical protein
VVCQFAAPELAVFVEMVRINYFMAQVRQETAFDHVEVGDIFVRQLESPLQGTAAAPFPVRCNACALLAAHRVETGAYQLVFICEHFI